MERPAAHGAPGSAPGLRVHLEPGNFQAVPGEHLVLSPVYPYGTGPCFRTAPFPAWSSRAGGRGPLPSPAPVATPLFPASIHSSVLPEPAQCWRMLLEQRNRPSKTDVPVQKVYEHPHFFANSDMAWGSFTHRKLDYL